MWRWCWRISKGKKLSWITRYNVYGPKGSGLLVPHELFHEHDSIFALEPANGSCWRKSRGQKCAASSCPNRRASRPDDDNLRARAGVVGSRF